LVVAAVAGMALALVWGCAKQAKSPAEKVYLHKIETGETLADIAEDYYGNASRAAVIGEFNGVKDDGLREGMVIRVPMTQEDIDRLTTRERARGPYNEGLELAENGSYVDAVERFQTALEIDPEFVDAEYNLGVTLKLLKSYPKAIEHLDRAVELRPDNVRYRFALGNCLFHIDRYGEAAEAFEKVVEADSSQTKALYSLAVCYEKLGEREKAVRAWERYLELDATSAWAIEARKRLDALRN
jgi:tetratricopeptide (TPR) repeat protein